MTSKKTATQNTSAKMAGKITVTDSAKEEFKALLKKEKKEGHKIRLSAAPGGCAGIMYGLGIDKEKKKTDEEVKAGNISIIYDESFKDLFDGIVIDYVKLPHGEGFKVDNPNQAPSGCSTCGGGCGC